MFMQRQLISLLLNCARMTIHKEGYKTIGIACFLFFRRGKPYFFCLAGRFFLARHSYIYYYTFFTRVYYFFFYEYQKEIFY